MDRIDRIRARLPKRLTISFPIWGLMDTNEGGAYHDLDRMVREHKERGFNCIRLESGAGLTHDIDGNRLPPMYITAPYGEYSINRQIFVFGGEGHCDFLQRLLDLCKACQKYDVYLILSSWYFLHTYWYCPNDWNDRILKTPADEMFMAFAKYLHYILKELEAAGCCDRIAFAEIFNEVLAVPDFIGELKDEDISGIDFKVKHEEALAWLQEKHPDILFAVDSDDTTADGVDKLPENLQVFNGHNYFLWGIYGDTLEGGDPKQMQFFRDEIHFEDLVHSRDGLYPLAKSCEPWYTRMAVCNDLNVTTIPQLKAHLERRMEKNWDVYVKRLETFIKGYQRVMAAHPNAPIICGEGVTYCSSKLVLWEEKSELYWNMVRLAMQRYKEIGLWGTVVKTCCGPEDPCWNLCADKLKELNEMFLSE